MKENGVGKALTILGWITIIFGTILGFSYFNDDYGRIGIILGITIIMAEIIAGIFILGFAEIIKILNEINIRLDYIGNKNYEKLYESSYINVKEDMAKDNFVLTQDDIEKVKEYYRTKNLNIENVFTTPFEDYLLVKLENKYELVDLGGFNPVIVSKSKLSKLPKIDKWMRKEGYIE